MSPLLTPVSIPRVPRLLLAGAMFLCVSQPAHAEGNTIEVPVNIPVTLDGSSVTIPGIRRCGRIWRASACRRLAIPPST